MIIHGKYYEYKLKQMITEIRCYKCNALLAKQFNGISIEIKCRRCKNINKIGCNDTGLQNNEEGFTNSFTR